MWAGQSIDRATAKAIVTAEAIDVTSLELHQGAGFLDGRVRYAWETGAYDANLKGDRLTWQGTVLSPNDTQAIFARAVRRRRHRRASEGPRDARFRADRRHGRRLDRRR